MSPPLQICSSDTASTDDSGDHDDGGGDLYDDGHHVSLPMSMSSVLCCPVDKLKTYVSVVVVGECHTTHCDTTHCDVTQYHTTQVDHTSAAKLPRKSQVSLFC